MAVLDVTTLINAAIGHYGQEINLKSGVTVRIDSVRRAGDGNVLVIMGRFLKDGVEYVPAGGWPVVWANPGPNFTNATALAALQSILADLVTA